MKLKLIGTLIILSTSSVLAQSAELVILEREALEAKRYEIQVRAQAKVMQTHLEHAASLAKASKKALASANKRQAKYGALIASEQAVADKHVNISEYSHVSYEWQASERDVAAKLHGDLK